MKLNQLQAEITMASNELATAQEREDASGEAMDSVERNYWVGYLEALYYVKSEMEKN